MAGGGFRCVCHRVIMKKRQFLSARRPCDQDTFTRQIGGSLQFVTRQRTVC